MSAPAITALDRARREQHEQLDLGLFDHLLERMPALMRPDQVSTTTGWSRRTIYELCETGVALGEPPLLEAHALPGRDVERKQITRRSVAALLLRTAKYDPKDFPALLKLTLPTMSPALLKELQLAVAQELTRKTKL